MARMTVRYFVTRKNKKNKDRYYWQPDALLRAAGWAMRRLPDICHEAMAEAERINAQVDEWRLNPVNGPVNETPGTVADVIAQYKKSRFYLDLSPRTKTDYMYYLDLISQWAGDKPATSISASMVQDLYEIGRKKSPRKAAYLIQVLRLVFNFAERADLIPKNSNPATKPGLTYKAEKGTIWSKDDIAMFVKAADDAGYFSVGTAVMLNEWLGQRRTDIVKMSMAQYRAGDLHIRQGKRGAEVSLPVDLVPSLKARIEQQIALNKTYQVTSVYLIQQRDGGRYTPDGFMSAFEKIRAASAKTHPEIKNLIFKNLRHTAVTRLAEAGAEIPMIAAVTGHAFKACQDIVDRYNIRTTKMAREAFTRRLNSEGEKA